MSEKDIFDLRPYVGALRHLAADEDGLGARRDTPSIYSFTGVLSPYASDISRLLNSKGLRRLYDKTQAFVSPSNPHVRTRGTHTQEVVGFAMDVARIVGLNIDLVQAIGWGHDIGHTPYGHLGEQVLTQVTGRDFSHHKFGVVVAQEIEREGHGLNLTAATLLGMRHHTHKSGTLVVNQSLPQECGLVMVADKIAFTFSDVEDVGRYQLLRSEELPAVVREFGSDQRTRVARCLAALVRESAEAGRISFATSVEAKMLEQLRQWMLENVYLRFDLSYQRLALEKIHDFFSGLPEFRGCDPAILLALLTDGEANRLAGMLLEQPRVTGEDLRDFGVTEIVPFLKGRKIDFEHPDLSWTGITTR